MLDLLTESKIPGEIVENKPEGDYIITRDDGTKTVSYSYLWKHANYDTLALLFIVLIDSLAYAFRANVLVLYLTCDFGIDDGDATIYYGLHGVFILFFSFFAAIMFNHVNPARLLWIGSLFEAIGTAILVFSQNESLVLFSIFALIPIGTALGIPVANRLVKQLVFHLAMEKVNTSSYVLMNVGEFAAFLSIDVIRWILQHSGSLLSEFRIMMFISLWFEILMTVFVASGSVRGDLKIDEYGRLWRADAILDDKGNEYSRANKKDWSAAPMVLPKSMDMHGSVVLNPYAEAEKTRKQVLAKLQSAKAEQTTAEETEQLTPYQRKLKRAIDAKVERYTRMLSNMDTTNAGESYVKIVKKTLKDKNFIKILAISLLFAFGTKMVHRNVESIFGLVVSKSMDPHHQANQEMRGCVASDLDQTTSMRDASTQEHHDAVKAGTFIPWAVILSLNPLMILIASNYVNARIVERMSYMSRFFVGAFVTSLSHIWLVFEMSYPAIIFHVVVLSFGEMFWGSSIHTLALRLAPLAYTNIWTAVAIIPNMLAKFISGIASAWLLNFCPDDGFCNTTLLYGIQMLFSCITWVGLAVGIVTGWFYFPRDIVDKHEFSTDENAIGESERLLSGDTQHTDVSTFVAQGASQYDVPAGDNELELVTYVEAKGQQSATDANVFDSTSLLPPVTVTVVHKKTKNGDSVPIPPPETIDPLVIAETNHRAYDNVTQAYDDEVGIAHASSFDPIALHRRPSTKNINTERGESSFRLDNARV